MPEFSTSNFIFVISYLRKKKIEPHVFALSVLQFILQAWAITYKSFNRRKKYVTTIEI